MLALYAARPLLAQAAALVRLEARDIEPPERPDHAAGVADEVTPPPPVSTVPSVLPACAQQLLTSSRDPAATLSRPHEVVEYSRTSR